MLELFASILVAAAAFMATNLENLILLVALMAATESRRSAIGWGYLVSVGVVTGLSVALGAALALLESQHLRWTGVLPLGAGLVLAGRLVFKHGEDKARVPGQAVAFGATLGLSLVHSLDSIAVYGPLFAETKRADVVVMLGTVAGLAICVIQLARYLADHRRAGVWLGRSAPVAVPFLLILVGIYILIDSPTDKVGMP